MAFDLVVKDGMIVDGSGLPRYRADIGVKDGKIVRSAASTRRHQETLNAEGRVVSPGFVDGHTHMDAQILGSDRHQLLLPGRDLGRHGQLRLHSGALPRRGGRSRDAQPRACEDIQPRRHEGRHQVALGDLPQFLDVLDALPKGINYAGYVGHCAIRTHVMGQRAFTDEATEDDLKTMIHHTRKRSPPARTLLGHGGRPPDLGRQAGSEPARHLGAEFETPEIDGRRHGRGSRANCAAPTATRRGLLRGPEQARDRERSADHLRPVQPAHQSGRWRTTFDIIERTCRQGGRMFAQVHSRALNVLLSFETQLPFDKWEMWRDMRKLPLAEQKKWAERRQAEATGRDRVKPYEGPAVNGAEARPPQWDWTSR
jgi:hypothetical protein